MEDHLNDTGEAESTDATVTNMADENNNETGSDMDATATSAAVESLETTVASDVTDKTVTNDGPGSTDATEASDESMESTETRVVAESTDAMETSAHAESIGETASTVGSESTDETESSVAAENTESKETNVSPERAESTTWGVDADENMEEATGASAGSKTQAATSDGDAESMRATKAGTETVEASAATSVDDENTDAGSSFAADVETMEDSRISDAENLEATTSADAETSEATTSADAETTKDARTTSVDATEITEATTNADAETTVTAASVDAAGSPKDAAAISPSIAYLQDFSRRFPHIIESIAAYSPYLTAKALFEVLGNGWPDQFQKRELDFGGYLGPKRKEALRTGQWRPRPSPDDVLDVARCLKTEQDFVLTKKHLLQVRKYGQVLCEYNLEDTMERLDTEPCGVSLTEDLCVVGFEDRGKWMLVRRSREKGLDLGLHKIVTVDAPAECKVAQVGTEVFMITQMESADGKFFVACHKLDTFELALDRRLMRVASAAWEWVVELAPCENSRRRQEVAVGSTFTAIADPAKKQLIVMDNADRDGKNKRTLPLEFNRKKLIFLQVNVCSRDKIAVCSRHDKSKTAKVKRIDIVDVNNMTYIYRYEARYGSFALFAGERRMFREDPRDDPDWLCLVISNSKKNNAAFKLRLVKVRGADAGRFEDVELDLEASIHYDVRVTWVSQDNMICQVIPPFRGDSFLLTAEVSETGDPKVQSLGWQDVGKSKDPLRFFNGAGSIVYHGEDQEDDGKRRRSKRKRRKRRAAECFSFPDDEE